MKRCRLCGTSKPLDEFHRSSTAPDGRQYRCKQCAIAAARQWAKDHPDAAKAADKKYREKPEARARRIELRAARAERIREQKRQSYARHSARINAEAKAKREADPERFREYRRREYEQNRDVILARNKAWAEKNRDRLRLAQLKRDFGLSLEDFEALLVGQRGKCAICQTDILAAVVSVGRKTGSHDRTGICVDHDHDTGRVRGVLCGRCNKGIGLLGDDPARLRAAARYLTKHQT